MDHDKQQNNDPDAERESQLPLSFEHFTAEHPSVRELVDRARETDATRVRMQNQAIHSPSAPGPKQWPSRRDIPGYIGAGFEKAAYEYEDEYVVKVLNKQYRELSNEQSDFIAPFNMQIDGLLLGKGVPGLEQIVTADSKNGVLVTKKVPGKPVVEMTNASLLSGIKKDHIQKLDETLRYMREKHLSYENAANVLFSPTEGFTIIDYRHYPAAESDDPEYAQEQQGHELSTFLREVLSMKSEEVRNMQNIHGEAQTIIRRPLGRKALAALVVRTREK